MIVFLILLSGNHLLEQAQVCVTVFLEVASFHLISRARRHLAEKDDLKTDNLDQPVTAKWAKTASAKVSIL